MPQDRFLRFATHGPFQLKDGTELSFKARIKELVHRFDEDRPGLSKAMGVYVIAVVKDSKLTPWYVGKTRKGFGRRLGEHGSLFRRLAEEANCEIFEIFLLPRMQTKRDQFRKSSGLMPSLEYLETRLIGACLVLNESLINAQKTSNERHLEVPGYIHDRSLKLDKSARQFRKMLRQRSNHE
jgi:hypothetical protein